MKGIAYIKKDGSKGTAVDRFEFDLDKGKIFFILSQSYRGIYKEEHKSEKERVKFKLAEQQEQTPWWKYPTQERVRL